LYNLDTYACCYENIHSEKDLFKAAFRIDFLLLNQRIASMTKIFVVFLKKCSSLQFAIKCIEC